MKKRNSLLGILLEIFISELFYYVKYGGEDTGIMKLYKYVSSYSNIVSVVQDDDYDSHGAKLYDSCGNGIDYASPRP